MPALLSDIVCSLATMVGHSFEPQSAIVNYYNPKSTMGGHVDDAEVDLSLPLVSLSLGLSAVFLFGGGTRQDVPTPIWLRSGDAIVVTGPARLCYHGVPRILADSCPEALLDAAEYERAAATAAAGGTAEAGGALACGVGLSGELVCEFMRRARLNLNVRQVVSDEVHFGTVGAQRSEALAMSSVLGCASGRRREAEE
jgi:alkylated DNA repair protein alkB family protein 1